jgi:hypothetical protein
MIIGGADAGRCPAGRYALAHSAAIERRHGVKTGMRRLLQMKHPAIADGVLAYAHGGGTRTQRIRPDLIIGQCP